MTVYKQTETNTQTVEARSAKTRLAPALGLFFLAPLIGEFLLGNLPITWLWVLLVLAPLYGGGALLIRETARRLKLGWPSIIVLGLTYAVIEEAFVTQTLFNPNYLGLRLLDYGYISSLGIGAWWTVFVLGIHTIWSTSVPIALVESLTPAARRTPWLGILGLVVTAVLFVIGCALAFFGQQQEPFIASRLQFLASGIVVVILIAIAVVLGRMRINPPPTSNKPPAVPVVGGTAFILSSAFMSLAILQEAIPVSLNVAGMIGLIAAGSGLLWTWSHRLGWSEQHRLAVAGGLLLTYGWYGFVQIPSAGATSPLIDTIGNAIFAGGALVLLGIAWKRLSAHQG
ncbi:MAG TPA: hypothetical protein PKE64_09370 [Anaerolineae bacterium]|nr:hypothetical protein [Anaerolineae bacterium]